MFLPYGTLVLDLICCALYQSISIHNPLLDLFYIALVCLPTFFLSQIECHTVYRVLHTYASRGDGFIPSNDVFSI